MSGALGVQLEKPGCYKLGYSYRSLHIGQINLSVKIVTLGSFVWALIILVAEVIYYAFS
jgi:cobalamin biosynthesis protein CobD/CbiB